MMVESYTEERGPEGVSRRIILPARFMSLDRVRKFFVQASKDFGMSRNAVDQIELAVDEAFSNVIEHSYGGESQEMIECSCQDANDRLIIVIKDCGKPFDPNVIPEPSLDACLEEREVGGLGMYFMNQLMDDVHYSFTSGPDGRTNCNALTMVKLKEQ